MGTTGGRRAISRSRDRAVTAAGLLAAAGFVVAAAASTLLPADVRRGVWLPLHLALAGAATTAIAATLPFFASSLLAAPPAPAAARVLSIALVATGAAAVATGVPAGLIGSSTALAPAGGVAFVAGIVALAWTTYRPLRGALGPKHGLVLLAYAAGIADVAVGASLGTLFVGGYVPVIAAWAALKPVHAWLNLLGFLTLIVAGTLIHLYPTVLGTRIPARGTTAARSVFLLVGCFVAAPPIVAAGYWLQIDAVARAGGLLEIAGAAGLAGYALTVWLARGRWTSDAGWHAATIGHLAGSAGWLAIGAALAGARTLGSGADPAGWSIDPLLAPLALGCAIQAIVGAWTHLLPSIGPGDAVLHARQRRTLAIAGRTRVAALQMGVLLLVLGPVAGSSRLGLAGALLAAGAVLGGLALLLLALYEGRLALFAALDDRAQGR